MLLPHPACLPKYRVSRLQGFTIDVPEFALEIIDLAAFRFDAVMLKSMDSPIIAGVSRI